MTSEVQRGWEAVDSDSLVRRCKYLGWSEGKTRRVIKSYVQFLDLKIQLEDYEDLIVSPPRLINNVWVTHRRYTRTYKGDCKKLSSCGEVIEIGNVQILGSNCWDERVDLARVELEKRFDASDIDRDVWGFKAAPAVVSPIAQVKSTIRIFIRDDNYLVKEYMVRINTPLSSLFREYSLETASKKPRFFYLGERVKGNSTPSSLGMEEGSSLVYKGTRKDTVKIDVWYDGKAENSFSQFKLKFSRTALVIPSATELYFGMCYPVNRGELFYKGKEVNWDDSFDDLNVIDGDHFDWMCPPQRSTSSIVTVSVVDWIGNCHKVRMLKTTKLSMLYDALAVERFKVDAKRFTLVYQVPMFNDSAVKITLRKGSTPKSNDIPDKATIMAIPKIESLWKPQVIDAMEHMTDEIDLAIPGKE
jgi:hypothetical protein